MEKTTNYQLNQWEPEDQVRRTDFNEDNAKIDAAIAGVNAQLNAKIDAKADQTELNTVRALATRSRFTKLWELTLTADSTEITIPLTGIDWSKWDKVHLDMQPTNGQQMLLYFNEVIWNTQKFSISGEKDHLMPRLTFHVGHTADRYVYANRAGTWATLGGSFSDLKKLIISEGTMYAGAKFILWGEE